MLDLPAASHRSTGKKPTLALLVNHTLSLLTCPHPFQRAPTYEMSDSSRPKLSGSCDRTGVHRRTTWLSPYPEAFGPMASKRGRWERTCALSQGPWAMSSRPRDLRTLGYFVLALPRGTRRISLYREGEKKGFVEPGEGMGRGLWAITSNFQLRFIHLPLPTPPRLLHRQYHAARTHALRRAAP